MPNANDIRYLRQSTLIPPDKLPKHVYIIGCGGLGSHAAFHLARIGCPEIHLYDPDIVEEHNHGSQLFMNDATDKAKVSALQQVLNLFSIAEVIPHQEEFKAQIDEPNSVVICLVHDMDIRIAIWNESGVQYNPNVELYIEARMGGLFGKIFAFNPSDPDQIAEYEKNLFPSKDAAELPCTARGVDYNCSGIGNEITNLVALHSLRDQGFKMPNQVLKDFANCLMQTEYWK